MRLLQLAFLIAVLAGCSNQPSAARAEDLLRARIDSGKSDRLKIVQFAKTAGQEGNVLGIPMYELSFTADAEFVDDAYYSQVDGFMANAGKITTLPASTRIGSCATNVYYCTMPAPTKARKGDRLHLTGSITFSKSGSAWEVEQMQLSIPPSVTR